MATIRKLIVEVVDARNLSPKDGHGTSSPYVVADFYGQRKRTQTCIRDLNPAWNEVLEFNVGGKSDVFGDMLELDVLHDKNYGPTRRNNFLGRIRLSSGQFVRKGEEALMYFPLEKKSLLTWIQGEIGLKIFYLDQVVPPPPVEEVKTEEIPPPPSAAAAVETGNPETPAAAEAEKGNVETPPNAAPPPDTNPSDAGKSSKEPPPDPAPTPEKEAEKPPEIEPLPPLESTEEVDPLPPPPESTEEVDPPPPEPIQSDEPTSNWIPSAQMMTSQVSSSISQQHRIAGGINSARPISRQSTVGYLETELPSERIPNDKTSYDLVEKMHYLFVRVVKARSLPNNGKPVVKIVVSGYQARSKPAGKARSYFEWDQTFAFGRDAPESSSILEVSVWDPPDQYFLGGICFDVTEIPLRDPPDSPLAPQWYRLEGGGAHNGDLMLATWIGTQADESFPDAWKTDTATSKSKVYLSPKLWYLRATVIEAQDIIPLTMASKEFSFQIKAQLGFQVVKTKVSVTRNGTPSWNEDLMFVAAEPFSDHLVFSLENRQPKGSINILGVTGIPLTAIERRVDDRKVVSRWFSFENADDKRVYKGRVHLRLCFDGGYHVMDEAAHVCSDYRPTARQLWKPPVGTVEVGVIGCRNLLPMKTVNGKGSTDAYAVAKYGTKWIRTRTVSDSLDPKWNEQYTWKVYDPSTVITIAVFDEMDGSKEPTRPDFRIGKVRIRLSTLETGKVYKNTYPLLLLSPTGMNRMGEIDLALRFVRETPTLDFLHVYTQPLLPLMHHIKPLSALQQDVLRSTAAKIIATHLSRSEPPLRREVVLYMLDADSHGFSMRKVRANWFRIINVIAGLIDVVRWIDDTRTWKKPTATILVHALLVMLVWFPDLIVPTFAFYLFAIGAWNYRFRSRAPLPHLDPKLSLAEIADHDDLDEEFDTMPSSSKPSEVVRVRYDKLRALGCRVQKVLGDFATQGERVQALVTWRDPRATGIFVGLCFVVAILLYLVPTRMVAMASGFYYFRHLMFRDRMPSPALNFFRRLPSLSDRMM